MNPRCSTLSLLGAMAFLVLAGCATTSQQTPPDGPPTAPPPSEPMTNPSPPSPTTGTTPWHKARVGDRVVYTFSANRVSLNKTNEVRVAGRLALEVVAVQAPWVWLRLSFRDETGKATPSPLLAKELLFPMSMEASRPLEWTRGGTQSAEELQAAGRTWEAQRYTEDKRPADGPLENRLYASNPGPLYLMNGLLSASTTLSGFGSSGGQQLTLVEFQEGQEGRTASPPWMQYPLGPGTWADTRVNPGTGEQLQRSCLSAERGYLLAITAPAPASGGAPCPSFADAELMPVEEALLSWIPGAADMASARMLKGTPTRSGPVPVNGRRIPALTFETPETVDGVQQIRYEIFASDPWTSGLDGLHYMARFSALAEGVDRVEGKDQRKPVFTQQLVGWGAWVGGAK
jgi:hypothetical protein